ncbi:MAG: hypothetical protein OEN23_06095 [Paracoccaceae bacterium]|nr:hypothetical protein [Paracoccaceae bacterium]
MKHERDMAFDHRKSRDRALILLLAGLILVTPPVGGIFHLDLKLAGVPFTLIYLFVVWAALILGTALLSRRLNSEPEAVPDETPPEPGA